MGDAPSKDPLLAKAEQLELYEQKKWYFNPQEYPWLAAQLRELVRLQRENEHYKQRVRELEQWESVQRRMLSNAQTDSDDWCPSCTKPYDQCRCNGVQL